MACTATVFDAQLLYQLANYVYVAGNSCRVQREEHPPRLTYFLAKDGFAFARRRSLTASKCPTAAAMHRGVVPQVIRVLKLAPALISASTALERPTCAAMCSGVKCLETSLGRGLRRPSPALPQYPRKPRVPNALYSKL